MVDAYGIDYRFIDKTVMLSGELMTSRTAFPREFIFEVVEVRRTPQADGSALVTVSPADPYVEAISRQSEFEFRDEQVVP